MSDWWFSCLRARFYLHRVAFVVVHAQCDLHVFRRLLLTAVELSLQQRDVDVVPHVSCNNRKQRCVYAAAKKGAIASGLGATWEDDFREAHFPHDGRAAVHKVREVLPDLSEVSGEELQGDEQAWRSNGVERINAAFPGGGRQTAGESPASHLGLCV